MCLHIGRETFVGHEVLVCGGECEIFIGDFVDIAPRVSIIAGTHEIDRVNVRSAVRGIRGILRLRMAFGLGQAPPSWVV